MGFYSNTCDPYYADQFILALIRFGDYKKCANQSLREVMVQTDVESFVIVKAIIKILFKTMQSILTGVWLIISEFVQKKGWN